MAHPCLSIVYPNFPTKTNQNYKNVIARLIQSVASSKKRTKLANMQSIEFAHQNKQSKYKSLYVKPAQIYFRSSTRKMHRPNTSYGSMGENSIDLFIPSTLKYDENKPSEEDRNKIFSLRKDRARNKLVNYSFNQNSSSQ